MGRHPVVGQRIPLDSELTAAPGGVAPFPVRESPPFPARGIMGMSSGWEVPALGAPAASPFGALLRQWRGLRGLSQLALAGEAATTTRHLSFLETGRASPSREMVLRLAEALDVPLRERNALLEATPSSSGRSGA